MSEAAYSERPFTILGVALSTEDWISIRQACAPRELVVRAAHNCFEARACIAGRDADLVISDANLPDGTWRDIVLCSRKRSDVTPVIVVSRLADEELWAEVLCLGGYDVIAKPIDVLEFARVIRARSVHDACR